MIANTTTMIRMRINAVAERERDRGVMRDTTMERGGHVQRQPWGKWEVKRKEQGLRRPLSDMVKR